MIRSVQSSDITFKKPFPIDIIYICRLFFNLTDDISRKLLMLALKSLSQRADSRAVSLTEFLLSAQVSNCELILIIKLVFILIILLFGL